MESLKEELQKLIWQYGWKVFEEVLPEVRKEVEAKTKKLVEDLKLDLEDHGRQVESLTENKIISMEVPVESNDVLRVSLESSKESSEIQMNEEVKEDKVLKELQRNKKLYQRERERETRRRNEEAGMTVEELLSEDNLKSWKASGYSKAYIARELVGCREEVVSRAYRSLK